MKIVPVLLLSSTAILANQDFKDNLAKKIQNAKTSGKFIQQKVLEKFEKCDCVKENINNNFYMACADTGAKVTDKNYLSQTELEKIIQDVKDHNQSLNADLDEPKIVNLAKLAEKYGTKLVQAKFENIKVLKNIKIEKDAMV